MCAPVCQVCSADVQSVQSRLSRQCVVKMSWINMHNDPPHTASVSALGAFAFRHRQRAKGWACCNYTSIKISSVIRGYHTCMLFHWRHLGHRYSRAMRKLLEGLRLCPRHGRMRLNGFWVNPTLTWNDKLERETVFACCQSSCERKRFRS